MSPTSDQMSKATAINYKYECIIMIQFLVVATILILFFSLFCSCVTRFLLIFVYTFFLKAIFVYTKTDFLLYYYNVSGVRSPGAPLFLILNIDSLNRGFPNSILPTRAVTKCSVQ